MSQQQIIDIQQNGREQNEANQQIIIEDDKSQFSEDFHSDQQIQPQMQVDKAQIKQTSNIAKVINPISPYGVFMKDWREKHPAQKMSMSAIGQIWKLMDPQQKQIYQKKFKEEKKKFEQYEALMLSIDPNYGNKGKSGSKNYFFPLHRIRAIMKQDESYTASTQNVSTMAKATEFFGQYLLQQVKKSTQGKKRIDVGDLFQTINNNQNNLWFLNCLIDEHNLQNKNPNKSQHLQTKKLRLDPVNQLDQKQQQKEKPQPIEKTQKVQKTIKTSKSKVKQLPKGQMKLTDMF